VKANLKEVSKAQEDFTRLQEQRKQVQYGTIMSTLLGNITVLIREVS